MIKARNKAKKQFLQQMKYQGKSTQLKLIKLAEWTNLSDIFVEEFLKKVKSALLAKSRICDKDESVENIK